jgi:hypothetical protein
MSDIKVIGFVGIVCLAVGLLWNNTFGAVPEAEASRINAETGVYKRETDLKLDKQESDFLYDQRMKEIQIQMEPLRVQAELEAKQQRVQAWNNAITFVAECIGIGLIIFVVGQLAIRLFRNRDQAPSMPGPNATARGPSANKQIISRRMFYQELSSNYRSLHNDIDSLKEEVKNIAEQVETKASHPIKDNGKKAPKTLDRQHIPADGKNTRIGATK